MRRVFSSLLLSGLLTGSVLAGECSRPLYLTFDVGNMRHAEHIANVLQAEKVTATFFLANNVTFRGDHALDDSWRGYWRARVGEGHVFGNHTWSHLYARRDEKGRVVAVDSNGKSRALDQVQYCAELKQVDTAFRQLTGQGLSPLWRAPGGRTTDNVIRWAASCGYPLHVGWSDAGLVGDELPSDRYPNDLLVQRAIQRLQPGDVVLMHLGIRSRQQPLAEALQPMIAGLKAKGFCFLPLGMGAARE